MNHLGSFLRRPALRAEARAPYERALAIPGTGWVCNIIADAVDTRQDAAGLDTRALADRLAADAADVRRRLAG